MKFPILSILIALLAAPLHAELPQSREQITLTFAPVVKHVTPAVVNIYTRHTEKVQVSPLFNDPFFNQFFGQGAGGIPRERVVSSLGSGVIVDAKGTIVTSNHVVKGSDKIVVVLADKREFEAHVEKIDARSDLAVLAVDAKGVSLPFLEFRDSDTLEVGDLVLAVGNPFGVGQTVTSGIISALARSAAGVSDYQFFIQTDAAINPGNSGGALVDMNGKLIGINTAIYTKSGGYQGIGFAIPANMVKAVLKGQANKSGGDIVRPWFGVAVQSVTREIADAQGLGNPRGVLIKQISPGSPAEQAGIKAGDILLTLGSGEVNDTQSLNYRIATNGVGAEVPAVLWRAGKELIVPVTFVIAPANTEVAKPVMLKGNHALRGVMVTALTQELIDALRENSITSGVLVARRAENAFGVSVVAGDIIVAVNGKQVRSPKELDALLTANARRLQITLIRGGAVMNLTVVQ